MARSTAKMERKAIDKVFILLGVVATGALLVVSALAWYGYHFATTMVTSELSAQKIYFPAKDSAAIAALPQDDREQMTKYAGQQLVTGEQAKVYANHFIAVHLDEIADGKTYAEVSSEATANPADQKLQAQKNALFQGQTLRGILLSAGYAYWTFGMLALYAAVAALAGAVIMAILVLLGLRHLRKLN